MSRTFVKMHGLGNDFVVLDGRDQPLHLDADAVRAIADRRTGVGCDQLIVLEPARHPQAALFMRILNADGGEVAACGNATRCVAALVGAGSVVIETAAGLLPATVDAGGRVTVDMGEPGLDWAQIPLVGPMDTLALDLTAGPLTQPCAVSMGNPHAVFFVADADAVDLATLGPGLEHHPWFPQRCNIEAATILASDRIRMRVWERGVGITRACGTGACASLVAAHRRGLTGRKAVVVLDGGELTIEWRAGDNHVWMTGPVATSFTGTLARGLLA